MVNIDGSFLIGIAAILTSIATLWRTARGERRQKPEGKRKRVLNRVGAKNSEQSATIHAEL